MQSAVSIGVRSALFYRNCSVFNVVFSDELYRTPIIHLCETGRISQEFTRPNLPFPVIFYTQTCNFSPSNAILPLRRCLPNCHPRLLLRWHELRLPFPRCSKQSPPTVLLIKAQAVNVQTTPTDQRVRVLEYWYQLELERSRLHLPRRT